MIVIRDTDLLKGKRLVATIGFFDGVHLGHRFLINELKEVAKTKGPAFGRYYLSGASACRIAFGLSAQIT